jgi:hypothetical protein
VVSFVFGAFPFAGKTAEFNQSDIDISSVIPSVLGNNYIGKELVSEEFIRIYSSNADNYLVL